MSEFVTETREPTVERAELEDYDALCVVLESANSYSIVRNGTPTWPFIEIAKAHLMQELADGNCYCIRDTDGTPVASVSFSQNDRKNMWSDGKDVPAVYFSKLMRTENAPTESVGILLEKLLAVAAECHAQLIRCDAVKGIDTLLAYYKQLGFSAHGEGIYPYQSPDEAPRIGILLETTVDILAPKVESLLNRGE